MSVGRHAAGQAEGRRGEEVNERCGCGVWRVAARTLPAHCSCRGRRDPVSPGWSLTHAPSHRLRDVCLYVSKRRKQGVLSVLSAVDGLEEDVARGMSRD